jgi:hypothetical protein
MNVHANRVDLLMRPLPSHNRVTESRHQEDPEGSEGGRYRGQEDAEGTEGILEDLI